MEQSREINETKLEKLIDPRGSMIMTPLSKWCQRSKSTFGLTWPWPLNLLTPKLCWSFQHLWLVLHNIMFTIWAVDVTSHIDIWLVTSTAQIVNMILWTNHKCWNDTSSMAQWSTKKTRFLYKYLLFSYKILLFFCTTVAQSHPSFIKIVDVFHKVIQVSSRLWMFLICAPTKPEHSLSLCG